MHQVGLLKLRLEELFINELGSWKYPNGEERPSIAVIPPFLGENIIIEKAGVECLIYKKPKLKLAETFNASFAEECYEVSLTQYNESQTLEKCQRLLYRVFHNIQYKEKLQKEVIKKTELQIEHEQANVLIDGNRDFGDGLLIAEIANAVALV